MPAIAFFCDRKKQLFQRTTNATHPRADSKPLAKFFRTPFPAPHNPILGAYLAHQGEAAFQQDLRRSVVLGKRVGSNGANPSARGGERDQLPGRFRGMAAILVTGSDAVGYLHDFVRAGRAGKTTQADDGVVRAVDNRKAVLPGIGRGSSVQSLEEFRGYLSPAENPSRPSATRTPKRR